MLREPDKNDSSVGVLSLCAAGFAVGLGEVNVFGLDYCRWGLLWQVLAARKAKDGEETVGLQLQSETIEGGSGGALAEDREVSGHTDIDKFDGVLISAGDRHESLADRDTETGGLNE